jgi:hypothetical protein
MSKHLSKADRYQHVTRFPEDSKKCVTIEMPFVKSRVRIYCPHSAIARIDDPDRILFPFTKAFLVVEYPLRDMVVYLLKSSSDRGFTRREIITKICDKINNIILNFIHLD